MNEFNNGDGLIEYTQILIILARKLDRMKSEDELSKAFKYFDKDNDGFISASDLSYLMESLGENFTSSQIQQMITEADIDGDGLLNKRGFNSINSKINLFIQVLNKFYFNFK